MQQSLKSKFDSLGYYVANDVLSKNRIHELETKLPDRGGSGTRTLLEVECFSDFCRELKDKPSLSSVLSGLTAIQGIYFHKTHDHNWSVQLHRDKIIPVNGGGPWRFAGIKDGFKSVHAPFEFIEKCVAVRVALDECKDGDLRIVPGSHLSRLSESIGSDKIVVVPQGHALVLRPNLLHASSKLVLSHSRRVLHYLFAPSQPPHNYRWYHAV